MNRRTTITLAALLLALLTAMAEPVDQVKTNAATESRCPYPRSEFITGCTIDPKVISFPNHVERPGDNWPVTWTTDGDLYSFFADGVGFTPQPAMFSMHPCALSGRPDDSTLRGRDIATDRVGRGLGGDVAGRKVSGLIAIPDPADGRKALLVAWVRNMTRAGGSSLMVSGDRGATWRWAWGDPDRDLRAIVPELGHPSWVQAGRGNAAAPDDHLYFYTHEGPTAYRLADRAMLGRVRRDGVLDRSRYEFFAGTEGQPAWSPDIRASRAVFTAAGQCYRPYGIYSPALKRYLFLTSNGGGILSGHRGTHTLGIYESERPWGPWRTVYWNWSFQPQWGVFAPQLVPAWFSEDGKKGWLLYSCWPKGPYKFNLQPLTLTTAAVVLRGPRRCRTAAD